MTIAFWCVLAAALIPYLFIFYAKATPAFMRGNHNKDPRAYEEALEGPRKRAYWTQLNGFEAFPPFAAGVIIAHLAGAPADQIDTLAMAFIACRLLHGVLYVADLDRLRSVAWTGGLVCVIGLFTAASGA